MIKFSVSLFVFLYFNSSGATSRKNYFNMKESFAKFNQEEITTPSLSFCASVCGVLDLCCGFNYHKVTSNCVLLTHCSYGKEQPNGKSHFRNGLNGNQCSRTNVALNKPCGQSSVFGNDPTYTCDKANDGSLSSYIHTKETSFDYLHWIAYGESFPYWWVDLQTSKSVKEVVIHNRQDEYYVRLHNVNVTVGDDLSTLHQCGYHDGSPENMGHLTFTCTWGVEGRYVQIMNMDASDVENFLHVTEVEVFDCWP